MHYLSHHLAPWKTKHLLVFIRICRIKIDMLGCPKTISHLASTDGFASTEGSTGLGSQDVGQPWRAKWEGLLNLKWLHVCRFFACFGRFEILEFVQCWVLFVSGCFYVFLQFNFLLASDLTIGFASWWITKLWNFFWKMHGFNTLLLRCDTAQWRGLLALRAS